jgi:pimeloyl-ACP methyl ester carboxylesterase
MPDAVVVFVHGLWMTGAESLLLRRRLAIGRGYGLKVFRYASVGAPSAHIIAALHNTIAAIEAPRVHLIGHSLGGLMILRCLERYPMAQPGRVVFLGTPAAGSRAARRFGEFGLGRRLLGAVSAEELLQQRAARWDIGRELGVIAGTMPLGFGRLLLKFAEDNDGTVALSETRVTGAAASLALPVTHSGMLWSARVAREAGSFLEYGSFGR